MIGRGVAAATAALVGHVRRLAWWPTGGVPLLRVTTERRALMIATRVERAARLGTPAAMDDLARFLAWVRLGSEWTVHMDVTRDVTPMAPTQARPVRDGEKALAPRRVSTVVLAMLEATRAPLTARLFARLLTGEPDAAQVMRTLLVCDGADGTFGELLDRWIAHDFKYGLASAGPVFLSEEAPLLTRFVERLQATPRAYAIAGEWLWSLADSFHPEGGVASSLDDDFATVQDDFSSVFDDLATVFAIPSVPGLGTGGRGGAGGARSSVGQLGMERAQRGMDRAQRRIDRMRAQQAQRLARRRKAEVARQRREAAYARDGLRVDHWGPIPSAASFTGKSFAAIGVLPLFHATLLLLLACPDLPRPLWQWIARYVDVLLSQGPRGRTVLTPQHRMESLILALAFHPVAEQPRALRRGAQMWTWWTDGEKGAGQGDGDDLAAAVRRWWTALDASTVGHDTLLEPLNQLTIERALRSWDRSLTLNGLKVLLLSGHRDVRATALRWVGLLSPQASSSASVSSSGDTAAGV